MFIDKKSANRALPAETNGAGLFLIHRKTLFMAHHAGFRL
jgi:hypothetical protein